MPLSQIRIVHQDDALLVVDKPTLLLSVPGRADDNKDCLVTRLQENGYPEARIVHRLDWETSGLMVLARDADSHRELSRQFHDRETEKAYTALCWGLPELDSGRIELPLRYDPPTKPRHVVDFEHGRHALTFWRVIERHERWSRVELTPITGRSHQLRVHMLSIGHPLLGDRLYANPEALAAHERLCLHASLLCLTHPQSGERLRFESPAPFRTLPAASRPAGTPPADFRYPVLPYNDQLPLFLAGPAANDLNPVGQYDRLHGLPSGATMRAELNQGLIDFLKASPTPFHATASLARRLEAAGYRRLDERDAWHTETGGRYYVTRNDSSLIAIRLGRRSPLESGFRLVGAHTDSPCLRVKPNPEIARNGFLQLGVEVYGGALFAPWFDRDLSLAGRVTFRANGKLESRLVDFRKAIAVIPNLAIHLNRAANEGWPINAQNELPPIIAQLAPGEAADFRLLLDEQLLREHGITADVVLDYELSFYDTQSAAVVGLNDEFIAGARLDNLLSCHAGLEALLNAEGDENCILVCTDHEEVGSCSHCGADGPFLEQVLRRLLPEGDAFSRAIQRSLLVSADNAHGVHPNYADRHDANHGPALNGGPVIKINSNQRYATNSETAGFFRHLCQDSEVPVQSFVTRSDMGCGSTIGPITASQVGVRTVDIGLPTFAMHSIRELAGSHDLAHLVKVLGAFYASSELP